MPLDPAYLRQHYETLSDEALLAVDRDELVAIAQQIYDEEVQRRNLGAAPKSRWSGGAPVVSRRAEVSEEEFEATGEDGDPEWLEDAAEVYSRYDSPGNIGGPEAEHARDVLDAAEIPCYLELLEEPAEDGGAPRSRWRLLVPGKLSQYGMSVLDRDIFNVEFEDQWRNHLEMLSDEEIREMEPEVAFCGLYDRIDRINRAYDDELKRRRMTR